MWYLVYFLPILSGTIADLVGFRRSLLVAFLLITLGYALMGAPAWLGFAELTAQSQKEITAGPQVWVTIIAGILLIGLGGSVVKPCISGTVQKTAAQRATLGFAIFYMVINVGSLVGRFTSYSVRHKEFLGLPLQYIFAVALCCAAVAFLVVLLLYRDPDTLGGAVPVVSKPRRSVWQIIVGMFSVLRNKRFSLFLLVSLLFNFVYFQVYNLLPMYVEKTVEKNPAMDLYTAANPLVIVAFQLLVTKIFGGMKPIRSMVIGSLILGLAMLINVVPVLLFSSIRAQWQGLIPIGSVFIVLTVALIAFGELFTQARTYEYIGALAPKGQEGLFLGYANVPMALGVLLGSGLGAAIFNEVICHGATKRPDGLLELQPAWNIAGWLIFTAIGLLSALAMWLFNRWLARQTD